VIASFSDFFPLFRQKMALFPKKQSYDQILSKNGTSWSKNANIFGKIFGENMFLKS
jgi:hypothetical protein